MGVEWGGREVRKFHTGRTRWERIMQGVVEVGYRTGLRPAKWVADIADRERLRSVKRRGMVR